MARPRKSDPSQRDWPRIRVLTGRSGLATFQVDSLRDLTPRVRKNFRDREDAERFAAALRERRNLNGLSALGLTPAEMDDARRALAAIKEAGFSTLTEAVRIAIRHHRPVGGDLDLFELREKFLASKRRKGRRERTIQNLAHRTEGFIQAFRREVANGDASPVVTYPTAKEISNTDVQRWFDARGFDTSTAVSAKNYLSVLRNFFNFAVKLRVTAHNPVNDVEIPEAIGSPPGILPLARCRVLLETARTQFPDFLPFVTLGLFCGLRPESEIARLTWDDVQLDRGRVHIARHKSKVALARNVSISANALEWLMLTPTELRTGPLFPRAYRQRWDRLRWHAGFRTPYRPNRTERAMIDADPHHPAHKPAEWPQDGMRHTFATNHLAHHRNTALTSAELGHLRPETITFYSGLEPQTDPAAYWSLHPEPPDEKIIALPHRKRARA